MNARAKSQHRRLPLTLFLAIAAAFLASGCLWGVVRDADTGAPLSGVTITYTDSEGHTGSTMTDAKGRYAFDIASGPVPAAGPVSFQLDRWDYATLMAPRLVEYNDNPNATLANPSSFWEVQSFNLAPMGSKMVEVELEAVDIYKALLAPSGGSTKYRAMFRAYGFADPTTPVCEQGSNWFAISSLDPPPNYLNFSCLVPGDTFRATVTVTVERTWTSGGGVLAEADISTAEWPWVAPGPGWMAVAIGSQDTAGPDDKDLEFTLSMRAREITVVPLMGP